MSILTLPSSVRKNKFLTYTLNKAELVALLGTFPSDTRINYYKNPETWRKVIITFQSSIGNQLAFIVFKTADFTQETFDGTLFFSSQAFDEFTVKSLVIHDYQNGRLPIDRADIPEASSGGWDAMLYENTVDGALFNFVYNSSQPSLLNDLSSSDHVIISSSSMSDKRYESQSVNYFTDLQGVEEEHNAIFNNTLIDAACLSSDESVAYICGKFGSEFNGTQLPEVDHSKVGLNNLHPIRVLKLTLADGSIEHVVDLPEYNSVDGNSGSGLSKIGSEYGYMIEDGTRLFIGFGASGSNVGHFLAINLGTGQIEWIKRSRCFATQPQDKYKAYMVQDSSSVYLVSGDFDFSAIGYDALLKVDKATGTVDSTFHARLSGITNSSSQQLHAFIGQGFVITNSGHLICAVRAGTTGTVVGIMIYEPNNASISFKIEADVSSYQIYSTIYDLVDDKFYLLIRNASSQIKLFEYDYVNKTMGVEHMSNVTMQHYNYPPQISIHDSEVYYNPLSGTITTFKKFQLDGTPVAGYVESSFGTYQAVMKPVIYSTKMLLLNNYIRGQKAKYPFTRGLQSNSYYTAKINVLTGEVEGGPHAGHVQDYQLASLPNGLFARNSSGLKFSSFDEVLGFADDPSWPSTSNNLGNAALFYDDGFLYIVNNQAMTVTDSDGSFATSGHFARIDVSTKKVDRLFNPAITDSYTINLKSMAATTDYIYFKTVGNWQSAPMQIIRFNKTTLASQVLDLAAMSIYAQDIGGSKDGPLNGRLGLIELGSGKVAMYLTPGPYSGNIDGRIYDGNKLNPASYIVIDEATLVVDSRHNSDILLGAAYKQEDNALYAFAVEGSTRKVVKYDMSTHVRTVLEDIVAESIDPQGAYFTDKIQPMIIKDGSFYTITNGGCINGKAVSGLVKFYPRPPILG